MNLYWQVYRNLEKELIKLADVIHFDDKQDKVYSIHIADLLVRVSLEIEAIARELYKENGGNMDLVDDHGNPRKPFFDSDCLQLLDTNWHITKRSLMLCQRTFILLKMKILF